MRDINRLNRFLIGIGIAILSYVLTQGLHPEIRFLLAYDLGMFVFLFLLMSKLLRIPPERILQTAQIGEPSTYKLLISSVIFSTIILVTIATLLDNSKNWTDWSKNLHLGLSLISIFLSWLSVNTSFAIHYASHYYDDIVEGELAYHKGLEFPDGDLLDYWDFFYYSFTIAMCFQTSDTSITSKKMRRFTLIHSLFSFLFVVCILGLVINVVSNVT